jgi:hypothetical protein
LPDGALEGIAFAGPELVNGNSNHAPMTTEARCALGRDRNSQGVRRNGRFVNAAWR